MSVSVGPAFAGYDASQMAIVTSCETTITSIVHDVNDNHAKLGKDIASGVAAYQTQFSILWTDYAKMGVIASLIGMITIAFSLYMGLGPSIDQILRDYTTLP